jgi:branched-chain amino acid transport system ATP-binding protein
VAEAVVEMRDVVAGYERSQRVLDGVSVTAAEGAITAILGPNGSGKSTTLRVLSGLLGVQEGDVLLRGESIARRSVQERLRLGVALLPQGRSTFPGLTVQDNLELGAWALRRDGERKRAAVAGAYERFPALADWRARPAGAMSGGMQQLLEIARMLLTDPQVLLIDEPSVGLSPAVAQEVYGHLAALRDEGRTVILVDQNVEAAVEICDYVYLLEFGRNSNEGPREEFAGRLGDVIRDWLRV